MPSNQGGDDFVFIVGEDGKKLPVLTGPADQAVFAVTITDTNLPISPGDTLSVDYNVENQGGVQATQDIRLDIDGSREDRDSDVTLAAGNSTTGTLSYDTAADDDRLRVIVWSDDTQAALDVSLNANYTVTIDSTNERISEGEELDVTATIENTGSKSGNEDITLDVGGATRDTYPSLSLDGGESKQITLTWTTSDGDAGDYTATVSSIDDSDTAPVSVIDEIDTFDDGDITEYQGDTGSFGAQTTVVKEGSHALQADTDGTFKQIESDGTLPSTPQQGDRWEVYFRYEDSEDWFYHGFNISGTAYAVTIDARQDSIQIEQGSDNAPDNLASESFDSSAHTDEWLRGIVTWYTDGVIELEVYDESDAIIAGPMQTPDGQVDDGSRIGFTANNGNTTASTMYYDQLVFLSHTVEGS